MQKLKSITPVIATLVCALALLLLVPGTSTLAQVPPSVTPRPTATNTGIAPSPTPDIPPSPTNTTAPTNTPITPTSTTAPTNTPITPSSTPRPTDTPSPTTEPPSKPKPTSRPDPNCKSLVKGIVTGASGQRLTGATVTIKGEGWERAMLTSDAGLYGFGGLCSGTAQLQAAMPGGKVGDATDVSLNGKDQIEVNLGISASGASVEATTAAPAGAPTSTKVAAAGSQAQATPEPSMPATGFPGWLLVGAALLGTSLLLLTAGVGTVLFAAARSRDRG